MAQARLFDGHGSFLEEIKIRALVEFLLYRGRLFQLMSDNEYVQKQYLELY